MKQRQQDRIVVFIECDLNILLYWTMHQRIDKIYLMFDQFELILCKLSQVVYWHSQYIDKFSKDRFVENVLLAKQLFER